MSADDYEEPMTVSIFWRVYSMPIILGGISLLFVALSITIFIKSYQPQMPITFSSDVYEASVSGALRGEEAKIAVDIEGAVIHPGVYRVARGSRIDDLIGFAGGFSSRADLDGVARQINRAAVLSDGAKIYIPTAGENHNADTDSKSTQTTSLMNINTASQSELESLTGVGPVTASKIINGRPYMRLEELLEKKIVSQSVFDGLKNHIVL